MTSNFDQTVYLSNKLDTMTSNFAGMREHVLVERSETAKKRSVVKQLVSEFMSRVAWTEVRTWRLYQLLWLLLVPRNPVRPQNRKMLFASAMSMSRLLLCPSATSQLSQRTNASCYFRSTTRTSLSTTRTKRRTECVQGVSIQFMGSME